MTADRTYGKDKLTIPEMLSNKYDAIEAGHSHYYTGKPCRNGHKAPRLVRNGECHECLRLHNQRSWKKKTPAQLEAKRKRDKAYRLTHMDVYRTAAKKFREKIKKKKLDAQNEKRLARIDELWNAIPGTPDGNELDRLVKLVVLFENKYYPMD